MFRFVHTAALILILLLAACTAQSETQTRSGQLSGEVTTLFRVSAPPDPNFLPLAVLSAKADEWMPGIGVEIIPGPGGDPEAMRDLVTSQEVDFALFNVMAGTSFYNDGVNNLCLVGTHVWKGVYMLAREDITDVRELEGQTILTIPSLTSPPFAVNMAALRQQGISANFEPVAARGLELWELLARPDTAPPALVAPEPMISTILRRQTLKNWPVKYAVLMDPQAVLSPETGEVPLGSVWLVRPAIMETAPQEARAFVSAFDQAIAYVNDPANWAEVATIGSERIRAVFGTYLTPTLFEEMLSAGRLGLDFRPASDIQDTITPTLKSLYDIDVPEGIYCTELFAQ